MNALMSATLRAVTDPGLHPNRLPAPLDGIVSHLVSGGDARRQSKACHRHHHHSVHSGGERLCIARVEGQRGVTRGTSVELCVVNFYA